MIEIKPDLVRMLSEWKDRTPASYPSDVDALADIGMLDVFVRPDQFLNATGLVFSGFGDHDIFPSMIEYKSCGILIGKHIATEVSKNSISHMNPAHLSAFAQTSMVDTFYLGLSGDVFGSVIRSINEELRVFSTDVVLNCSPSASVPENIDSLIEDAVARISNAVLDRARREHALPLRRVLGVLPIEEMADLAETLIRLQSLKEKVTKPSETVGGPIDVAVITKSEGLIWIKRKHFFDTAINSRYLQRQASAYR